MLLGNRLTLREPSVWWVSTVAQCFFSGRMGEEKTDTVDSDEIQPNRLGCRKLK